MNASPRKTTLLVVDDEKNILSALKRLFRAEGYQVFTAESGVLGLEILNREDIDVVISDMRMPEMDGAAFLKKVAKSWSESTRILMTGHNDLGSTITSINEGRISYYIQKPWDDKDFIRVVLQALRQKNFSRSKACLEVLIQDQNQYLGKITQGLGKGQSPCATSISSALFRKEGVKDHEQRGFFSTLPALSG